MTCNTYLNMKSFWAAVCLGFSALASDAQPAAMKGVFVNAPREVISTIDSITRIEMILYNEAGSSTQSKNLFGGGCRINYIGDEEIRIATSVASEIAFYRLPASKGDSVILAINSINLPALDSRATMYASDWHQLPAKMQLPSVNDLDLWLTEEGKERRMEIENLVPFITSVMIYSSETSTLSASSTLPDLIGKDEYEKFASCLKKVVRFKWNGRKWTLM